MDLKILEDIGLTKSEIKVYLALLELGPSTKGPVVHKSGVASSKIYYLLEKLMEKGLVSYIIRANVKHFEAVPPRKLLDYVEAKKEKVEIQKENLKKILPQLEMRQFIAMITPEARIFRGMGGARTSFNDILTTLKKGEEYYVLGVSTYTQRFERFVINFHKKRAKCSIRCKIMVNEVAKDIGRELESIPLTEVRYIPIELFSPVVFHIYKYMTLISISLEEMFIQIHSKHLSDGLRTYAKYMFSLGKREMETAISTASGFLF